MDQEIMRLLAANGPFAIATFFLGKVILAAWAEDRQDLKTVGAQTAIALARLDATVTRVGTTMESIASKLDGPAGAH